MKDKYSSYFDIKKSESKKNFSLSFRKGRSGFLVMTIHGGGIEVGTSEIAKGIAGRENALYLFEGNKTSDNRGLHITSKKFDESLALKNVLESKQVITIHGCKDKDKVVYVGGRDRKLVRKIKLALEKININVKTPFFRKFHGRSKKNICNKNKSGKGVQLEISFGLRKAMFENINSRKGRGKITKVFDDFVKSIRGTLGF